MTQRTKNTILVVGIVCLFIFAYIFSFSNTLEIGNQLSILKKKERLYQSAPSQLSALNAKEIALDQILKSNNISGNSLQNNLLKMLNSISLANPFKIIDFKNPHITTNKATNSETTVYDFTLEGNYNTLQEVIYLLEQKYSFGNVIHVSFSKEKNYRTGRYSLTTRVLLQHIN